MRWQERRGSVAIAAFSAALAAGAMLLLAGPLRDVRAPLAGPPWWALVPAFLAAELVVVHVQARRESLTVGFGEIPLAVGLAFVAPLELVAARLLGSGLGLLHSRQSGLKLTFNTALFGAEVAVASSIYHALLAGADPSSARGLAAALATTAVADLVAASAVTAVVWMRAGTYEPGVLREAFTSGLVAAVANTSVGLLAVVVLRSSPVALVPLLVVAGTLALAYRGYSTLSRGHARLDALYRFTRGVQTEVATAGTARTVLGQARDVLAARSATLLLLPTPRDAALRLDLDGDELRTPPPDDEPWWAPARAGRAVRVGASVPGDDALAAPVVVEGRVAGVLAVRGRPHHLGPFTEDDLRLFESMANHAAVSLHRARLVDALREEAAAHEHSSLHDALTGLPNRRHALRALAEALAVSDGVAVVVLDLEGFTDVNEALGHATGDELLRETGRRLGGLAGAPGHVARLGNDEFAVVLDDVRDEDDALGRAARVLARLAGPVRVHGLAVELRACAGVAVAPGHGDDADLLLQRADAALYRAKRERVALHAWDPGTDGDGARRLTLLAALRDAVTGGRLDVHYQPKVRPGSGELLGAEALVRWDDPALGRVPPDVFVPLAEQAGLVGPLTAHVLAAALGQCALWREHRPELGVSVNVSARSLADPDLPEQVAAALARAALPPGALTLEITETAVVADLGRAVTVLHALRDLGVRLSVDDFGTGQSSLTYLKRLPVHEVKVDRSFVTAAASDAADAAIVRAAVQLGHALGLEVVAEGVEDGGTLRLLSRWGCDAAQGYHMGRPVPAQEFAARLQDRPGPVGSRAPVSSQASAAPRRSAAGP